MTARDRCLLALLGVGLTACTLRPVELVGRSCPCPLDLTCDAISNRCIPFASDDGAAGPPDSASGLPTPIGHWSLDEQKGVVAMDVGSGHRDAVVVGGAPTWIDDAQRAGALQLPLGAALRVATLDGTAFPTAGTLSFWFRGDVVATTPVLRPIFDAFDDTREHFFVRVGGDDKIQIAGAGASGKPYIVTTLMAAPRAVWHRLVMTWQTGAGAAFSAQVDDTLFTAPMQTTWAPSEQLFTFGGVFPDLVIDDIILFDRPLTPTEISALP